MSPEQIRGASSVDHRADLYSLGMCLFHMLTGDFAYYAPHYSDILVGICTLPLPRLREKAPWAPDAVEQWFQRACAKEPLERFQSADEMSEALQAAGGGMPLSKHHSSPEGRIAPETLVGYAAPALATLLDAGPATLARTQQVVAGAPLALNPPMLVPIAVGTLRHGNAGAAGPPPRTGVPPLALGVGLGVAVVVALGVLLALFGGLERSKAGTSTMRSATAVSVSAAPVASVTTAQEAPQPGLALELEPQSPLRSPLGSSGAAEIITTREKPLGERKATGPRKPSANVALKAPHAAPNPAPGKTPGSDLGF
jgi:serine/threonine-protein kinase